MTREEVEKLRIKDPVKILIGPYKGRVGYVYDIDASPNSGASFGWITVTINHEKLLFAGEEICKIDI